MKTTELQQMLRNYQSGMAVPQSQIPASAPLDNNAPIPLVEEEEPQGPSEYQRIMNRDVSGPYTQSYTQPALHQGFGTSKYDTDYYPGMDVENQRALAQSGWAKIGAGVTKGGITAATTYVNTTAGTITGIGAGLFELALDRNGNGRGVRDTFEAGVNNWLSERLVNIQKWSEEAIPNYKTSRERTEEYQDQFMRHLTNANFIGDDLIKNFGFTIGAIFGGATWSKYLSKAMRGKLSGDIMKGATIAAEGDAEASAQMKQLMAELNEANFVRVDANKISQNLQDVARKMNSARSRLQLYGATIAAMGEGSFEGLNAKQEFLDEFNRNLGENYEKEKQQIYDEVLNSNFNAWVNKYGRVEMMPDGSTRPVPTLTKTGMREVEIRVKELDKKYVKLQQEAQEEGEKLAATTWALNIPVLIVPNTVQFGRMLSGGWKTARKLATVNGGIDFSDKAIKAAYKNRSVFSNSVLKSLKVGLSEAGEEMAQGFISSGTKNVANSRIASFNNMGYDDEATHTAAFWIANYMEGGMDYLSDQKNWKEGLLGAITGLFGIPGKRWNGGVFEAVREAKEEKSPSDMAAAKLNTLVNSKEFQDRWHGFIRHIAYDDQMKDALAKNDEYAWHTADNQQLISDVIMFADAGRLDDLNDIVSYFAHLDADDIKNLKQEVDWAKNMSDEDIQKNISKQANKMSIAINRYKDIYDAIMARVPIGSKPEYINEIVATAMEIHAYEDRFLELIDELQPTIQEELDKIASVSATDEDNVVNPTEKAEALKDLKQRYIDALRIPVPDMSLKEIQDKALNRKFFGDLAGKIEDEENKKKLQDLLKIADDRTAFYNKLKNLQTSEPAKKSDTDTKQEGSKGAKKFDENAITPNKVEDVAENVDDKNESAQLNSVEDVREAYYTHKADERAAYVEKMRRMAKNNSYVATFLKIKDLFDRFSEYVNKYLPIIHGHNYLTPPYSILTVVGNIIKNVNSVDELINLPDNAFMSYDTFAETKTFLGNSPERESYTAVLNVVRKAMEDFLAQEGDAEIRRQAAQPVPDDKKPKLTEEKGTDAPQPTVEKPVEKDNKDSKQTSQAEPSTSESVPITTEEADAAIDDADKKIAEDSSFKLNDDSSDIPDGKAEMPMGYTSENELDDDEAENDKVNLDTYQKGYKPYIETSSPEIARGEYYKAKRGEDADFSDFEEKNPSYSDTLTALRSKDAFGNMARAIPSSERNIEFVIDPTFPLYEGRPQILIAQNINGERKILNTLPQAFRHSYLNLRELTDAITEEYNKFIEEHPNELFVFSKKSSLYHKKAGILSYGKRSDEKDIRNIRYYDDNCSIVYVDRDGTPIVIKGDAVIRREGIDPSTGRKIGARNAELFDVLKDQQGKLYYLSRFAHVRKKADGVQEYTPIRLGVEHLKEDIINLDKPVFNRIRENFQKIVELVQQSNNTNAEENNLKLRSILKSLVKDLDIHDVFLNIRDVENVGVALVASKDTRSQEQKDEDEKNNVENDESWIRRPDQITYDWLANFFIESKNKARSLQVRKSKNGNVENFDDLLDQGLITSSVQALRPLGAELYFLPWNTETNDFKVSSDPQVKFMNKLDSSQEYQPSESVSYDIEEKQETKPISDSDESRDNDEFDFKDEGFRQPYTEIVSVETPTGFVKVGSEISVDDVFNMYKGYTKRAGLEELREISSKVFGVAKKLGLKVYVRPSDSFVRAKYGRYNRNGVIELNAKYLQNMSYQPEMKANLLLHETIHATTAYIFNSDTKKMSKGMREALKTFNEVYEKIKNDKMFEGTYGVKSVEEMVAELSSYSFRRKLKARGLWQRIVDAFRHFFGIESDTLLDKLDNALERALTSFDSKLYNEYSETKNTTEGKETDKELSSIKEKAIADGIFMKAPNGKPTNLTERQWLQVRTKAFKDWFGDWEKHPESASKVVDENGEPLVVYHYTDKNFDEFKKEYVGDNWEESLGYGKKGFFFLSVQEKNNQWGTIEMPVFLNIRNPEESHITSYMREKVTNDKTDGLVPQIFYDGFDDDSGKMSDEYMDWIKSLSKIEDPELLAQALIDGMDGQKRYIDRFKKGLGFIGKKPFFYGEFVVFDPNQIKSATRNVGTFSLTDNNIYYFESGEVGEQERYVFENMNPYFDTMNQMPKELQDELIKKGYTEGEYNSMPIDLKDQIARCAGVI